MEDALWSQGIRKPLETGKKRHEFQADHGYRKWFKTQCEVAGMKSINIELLMGHSIGISDSYYRISESDLPEDYLKAIDFLTMGGTDILRRQMSELSNNTGHAFNEQIQLSTDAIAALSDKIQKMQEEIDFLRYGRSSTS